MAKTLPSKSELSTAFYRADVAYHEVDCSATFASGSSPTKVSLAVAGYDFKKAKKVLNERGWKIAVDGDEDTACFYVTP